MKRMAIEEFLKYGKSRRPPKGANMKRMTIEEFLKLVEKLGACDGGILRFKDLKGSLRTRLLSVRKGYTRDWNWLTGSATCLDKNCEACDKRGLKTRVRVRNYLVAAGLIDA